MTCAFREHCALFLDPIVKPFQVSRLKQQNDLCVLEPVLFEIRNLRRKPTLMVVSEISRLINLFVLPPCSISSESSKAENGNSQRNISDGSCCLEGHELGDRSFDNSRCKASTGLP
jgi:hypothetical protein